MAAIKNKFIYVTNENVVYDRTGGKNRRVLYNTPYYCNTGYILFERKDGVTVVKGFSKSGSVIYEKELTEAGFYNVSLIFAQKIDECPSEVRFIYKRLKNVLCKPNFKIDIDEKIRAPYKVLLHTWIDEEGFKYRFTIKIKESLFRREQVEEVYNLVYRTSLFDLKKILNHYKAFDENSVMITITEETLYMFETICNKKIIV